MLESHLVSERQFLYWHLVDVGMFPAHKMWPNVGVHTVGSESNRIRRAEKQSGGIEPTFFAVVSALFFPRQFFTRALNALNRLNKMWKQQQQQNISINAGWKFRQKFYHNCSTVLTPSKIQPASKLFLWRISWKVTLRVHARLTLLSAPVATRRGELAGRLLKIQLTSLACLCILLISQPTHDRSYSTSVTGSPRLSCKIHKDKLNYWQTHIDAN